MKRAKPLVIKRYVCVVLRSDGSEYMPGEPGLLEGEMRHLGALLGLGFPAEIREVTMTIGTTAIGDPKAGLAAHRKAERRALKEYPNPRSPYHRIIVDGLRKLPKIAAEALAKLDAIRKSTAVKSRRAS